MGKKRNRKSGFTLLETLVAFALLSILLTTVFQTQSETIFFIEKTGKLSLVQRATINELLILERDLLNQTISVSDGVFGDDHVLAGDRWQKEVVLEKMMLGLIQVKKIKFKITWNSKNGGREQSFESSIIGEVI